jgi:hypothetical protein
MGWTRWGQGRRSRTRWRRGVRPPFDMLFILVMPRVCGGERRHGIASRSIIVFNSKTTHSDSWIASDLRLVAQLLSDWYPTAHAWNEIKRRKRKGGMEGEKTGEGLWACACMVKTCRDDEKDGMEWKKGGNVVCLFVCRNIEEGQLALGLRRRRTGHHHQQPNSNARK